MPKITTILAGALCAAIFTIMSMPAAAQYYGGLPLGAVKAALPEDVTNLLFRPRFFALADRLENGGAELKVGYRFSSHRRAQKHATETAG